MSFAGKANCNQNVAQNKRQPPPAPPNETEWHIHWPVRVYYIVAHVAHVARTMGLEKIYLKLYCVRVLFVRVCVLNARSHVPYLRLDVAPLRAATLRVVCFVSFGCFLFLSYTLAENNIMCWCCALTDIADFGRGEFICKITAYAPLMLARLRLRDGKQQCYLCT